MSSEWMLKYIGFGHGLPSSSTMEAYVVPAYSYRDAVDGSRKWKFAA